MLLERVLAVPMTAIPALRLFVVFDSVVPETERDCGHMRARYGFTVYVVDFGGCTFRVVIVLANNTAHTRYCRHPLQLTNGRRSAFHPPVSRHQRSEG